MIKEYGSTKYVSDEINGVVVSEEYKSKKLKKTVYSHISPTILKEMKADAKMSKYISGNGEVKPIYTLEKGTEIKVTQMNIRKGETFDYMSFSGWGSILLTVISGPHKGTCFSSDMKAIQNRLDTAHFEDLAAEQNTKPKYKIFYKGEPYRIPGYNTEKETKGTSKIFADIGKVKASLMGRFGYLDKVYQLNKHYQDISPEVGYNTPEWMGVGYGGPDFNRKDMKDVQVFEWANRKKGKEADFNALEYYDSLMDFAKVTAQYGSSTRDCYKKHKENYGVIVLFKHEDYILTDKEKETKYGKYYYNGYEELKESDTIKQALKDCKVKDKKKTTKNGKTAIAFKNISDAMKLIKLLPKKQFHVMDMSGIELIEQSDEYIQDITRMKKLERILKMEFEDTFDIK